MRESLLPLAESVADGTSVDWDEAARHATPEDRAFVQQLGVLAKLTELHRTLSDAPGTTLPSGLRRRQGAPAIGTWAHLTLLERLGGGTFGEVYRAWDRQLEREVALKLLKGVHGEGDDPETSRITREGRLLARVRHPNVITVHGVDVHDGRVGLWMELLRGQTLEQQLNTRGAFGAREAALVGIDICRALAAIHAAGLLHRDVKAENVIREDGGRIVLMDLGTGREIDPSGRRVLPDFAGTPLYIAPEVFEGAPASEATDVYSLGVLLYHLVTASYPVWAKTVDELKRKHTSSSPIRLRDARADLPTVFVAVVDRAIAKDRADRYLTAGALEADLLKSIDDDTLRLDVARSRVAAGQKRTSSRRPLLAIGAIAAAMVVAGGLLAWPALRNRAASPAAVGAAPIRSIAVLPLANMSGDPGQEYFADGMTDELIGTLGRLRSVNVISRTSSMPFKGTDKTLPDIAQALGVDAVVEGSVMMVPGRGDNPKEDAGRLRINARLIRAGTDTQLWDRTFETASADVFKLQRDIAAAVAEGIHATLTPAVNAAARPAGQRGQTFDAFDLYLKGRYYWNMRTPDALKQSVQYFQESIARGYVPAYAGLADAYTQLGYYGVMRLDEAQRRALDAATKALELDPTLAEAYSSRGVIELQQLQWSAAAADLRKAIETNPGYAPAHQWYAIYLSQQGRFQESVAEAHTATALDPLSISVQGQLGVALIFMRRYGDAIAQLRQTLTLDPSYVRPRLNLAEALAHNGQYGEALSELQRIIDPGPEETNLVEERGYVYAVAGRRADALAVARALAEKYQRGDKSAAYASGVVYAGLGDRDRAIMWLNEASLQHDPLLGDLKGDPRFDMLRGDARFVKLLETVGLAK